MKTLTLLISLAGVSSAFAGTFMLEGTYVNDQRYDVNKIWDGNDDNLCWAAAGSNLIKYWQNSYAAHGNEIPAGIPLGNPTNKYNSDIFEVFVNNWTNEGGYAENALQWWFNGSIPIIDADASTLKTDSTASAYWGGELPCFIDPNYNVFTSRYFDEDLLKQEDLKGILDNIILNDLPTAAAIYRASTEAGHAIALWGYEYDDVNNVISGLWISDSDDDYTGNRLVGVLWNDEESMWYLQDYYEMNDWFLGVISSLVVPVPEPSAYAAFFGVFGLVAAFCRRRRK